MKTNSIKIRELCIKRNWFTLGTNEAYNKLLTMADSGELEGVIDNMAQCIYWNTVEYCHYGSCLDEDKDLLNIKRIIIEETTIKEV